MSHLGRLLFPSSKYNALLAGAYCSLTGIAGYYAYKGHNYLSAEKSPTQQNLLKVQKAFIYGEALESADNALNICGRIKCMKVDQLTHLSGTHKPFSWVIGNCGLYQLSKCKSDYDKLLLLGAEKDWIELQLWNGNHFNLYLFPEISDNYTAKWATWQGVFELLKENESEIYKKILPFKEDLINTPFDDIEAKSSFEYLDVEELGPKDPRYLTKDRFLNINDDELTLSDSRFLLYCYLGLSKYFDGNGYTKDEYGKKGCKEYLIKNMKLDDMENIKLIELDVKIPEISDTIRHK